MKKAKEYFSRCNKSSYGSGQHEKLCEVSMVDVEQALRLAYLEGILQALARIERPGWTDSDITGLLEEYNDLIEK